jgi:hypothetical protein
LTSHMDSGNFMLPTRIARWCFSARRFGHEKTAPSGAGAVWYV